MTNGTCLGSCLALAMACSAEAGTGDLLLDDLGDGMISVIGCVDTGYEAMEYYVYLKLETCTEDCVEFDWGVYNDAGTPFTSHNHEIEIQNIGGQDYIVLHGKKPSGSAVSGEWRLAALKFTDQFGELGLTARDIYFRNPSGGDRSDFKNGSTWRYVSQHPGNTDYGTETLAAAATCMGFDFDAPVYWFIDPCGKLFFMPITEWEPSCCATGTGFGYGTCQPTACVTAACTTCPTRTWYKVYKDGSPGQPGCGGGAVFVTPLCGPRNSSPVPGQSGSTYCCNNTTLPLQPYRCWVNGGWGSSPTNDMQTLEWCRPPGNCNPGNCRRLRLNSGCGTDDINVCPRCFDDTDFQAYVTATCNNKTWCDGDCDADFPDIPGVDIPVPLTACWLENQPVPTNPACPLFERLLSVS